MSLNATLRVTLSTLLILSTSLSVFAQEYETGIQQSSIGSAPHRIAFVLAGRLWFSESSSGAARLLDTGTGRVESPVLSPDGREILFLRWNPGFQELSLISIETATGRLQEITRRKGGGNTDFDVNFSKRQAVLSSGEGLISISLESGRIQQLTDQASDRLPRVSPDGWIAFARTLGDSHDIWVLDPSQETPRRVQSSVTLQERFDWAPDGQAFVLESLDTGNLELWTLPLAGGAARRITDDIAMDSDPVWAADRRIYFHRNRQLWTISEDGSDVRRVKLRASLPAQNPKSLLVRGGRVLDLGSGDWIPQDVLIQEGRIRRMGADLSSPDSGIPVFDAKGLFLLPGLLDLHTHYDAWMSELLLDFGVTVMRDLGSWQGTGWILDERQFVRDGHLMAPEILTAGVVMNGSGPGTIGQIRTEDPQLIARTVEWLADQGVDLIKIGSENTYPMLEATVRTAHLRGLPVWGHIALVPTREAILLGQDGIEHLRGSGWYSLHSDLLPQPVPRRLTGMRQEGAAWWSATDAGLISLAQAIAEAGTQLDPTLTVMDYLGQSAPRIGESVRDRIPSWVIEEWEKSRSEGALAEWGPEDFRAFSGAAENQRKFVKAFHDAGGTLTTGSDVGVELVVPGLSIHQEMSALVEVGLSPLEAIRAATSAAARASRVEDRAGSLEVGKWGDLVILKRNPLENIENTLAIRAVVKQGQIVTGKNP